MSNLEEKLKELNYYRPQVTVYENGRKVYIKKLKNKIKITLTLSPECTSILFSKVNTSMFCVHNEMDIEKIQNAYDLMNKDLEELSQCKN